MGNWSLALCVTKILQLRRNRKAKAEIADYYAAISALAFDTINHIENIEDFT
jgi:hypothetical protein